MKKHRKLRKRELKKQRKIILASIVGLTLLFSVGYAAFNTSIKLNAKGNAKTYNVAWQLKKNIVTSGDGLYNDGYTNGRYVYRGSNPDNYICLDNQNPCLDDDLYRIVAVEPDETLKLLKVTSIGNMPFDSLGNRNSTTDTFCTEADNYGCNVWVTTELFESYYHEGTITKDSTLKTYLNSTYYESLDSNIKNKIINYDYYYGATSDKTSGIINKLAEEKKYSWQGKIGLLNDSDFYNASSSLECQQTSGNNAWLANNSGTPICNESNNYISYTSFWIINGFSQNTPVDYKSQINNKYFIGNTEPNRVYNVNPVIHITKDIKLSGKGTELEPYQIINS